MKKLLHGLMSAVLLVSLVVAIPITSSAPARASVADKCDGTSTQNTTKVTAQHGKIFYIDSGQGQNVDAAYVSYKITNTNGSTAKSDIWVHLDSFVGGVVKLANARDESQPIGAISANGNATAFFLLKASTSSTKAQSHIVRVYQGNPDLAGAQELYSCTYSFIKVSETIKASANKVTSVVSTTVSKVGQTMTITVEGNTGIVGDGNSIDGRVIWLSPAARSTWPTQALRLESTSFDLFDNPSRGTNQRVNTFPKTDTLIINTGIVKDKYYYTAVYTFRIIGNAGTGVPISPLAQISSGTQMKHTDLSGSAITGGSLTVTPTTDLVITKSLSGTTTYSSGTTTFTYSITLNNSTGAAPVDVDLVTDSPDAQLSFVSGSATYNSSTITDPSALATDSTKLVFSGPFIVPNGASRVISYRMTKTGCTSGAYTVTNSATAQIGSLTIGSGASTYSQVAGNGTCGTTTVTPTVTNPTITPSAITNPATGISTTAATLNASIDPEGTAGQSVSFLWGTSPTLATSTTANLTASSNLTTSYAVSTSLSSLAPGTTYYFRIKLGDILGDILSFTTYEIPATPTVATTTASDFVAGSGSTMLVQLNGSVDPNQVVNGVKTRFKYVPQDNQLVSGDHTCQTSNIDGGTQVTVPSVSTFVQTQTDEESNGSAIYGDAIFGGSFATDVTYMNTSGVTTVSLTANTYYCYQIIGYYNSATADWATAIAGAWVPFYASVKTSQSITFPSISTQTLGVSPITLGATASSGLAVSYTSNDESVCTVAYDNASSSWKVTVLTAGYCSITATQAGNDSVSEAEPVTIVFQVTVTLTYAGNSSDGGSVPSAYTGGGEVTLDSAGTMSKTGFTFSGWTIDGVSYFAGDKYNLTASKTATAIWKNTVTYDPRSGTVSPTSAQFTFGGTGLTLPTPSRDGYAFTGWYTSPTGGSNITSTYSPTASITLYAQWAVVYTVTFNANGGTGAASVSTVTQTSSGASVTLATKNTLALDNSGFMGWGSATSAGTFYAAGDSSYVPSNNHSLYAQWITTGGASSVVNTSATISGTASLTLTSPKFCYSATNPGAGTNFNVATCSPVNASGTYTGYSVGLTGLNASTTYYYQITGQISSTNYYGAVRTFSTAATYEVTYDVNGGTGSVPNAQSTSAGGSITLNNGADLSKSNSNFIGWSSSQNNGSVVSGSYTPTNSVLLYAQWITTTAATSVGSTTATINGTASATLTSPTFCYGTDIGLSGCTSGAASGTYTRSLTGLTPGTTYYFRVSGTVGGTVYNGGILSFTTTAAAPTVTTVAASNVQTTSATLNGTINANAASTSTTFCWGTDSNLSGCATVTATPSTVTGTTNTSISYSLSGLSESTLYYFRAIGVNSVNTTNGNILSFTTSSATITAPVPVTTAASSITTTTATLNGTIETGGGSTTVIFEYCASTTSGCTSSTMSGSPSTASAGSVTGSGAIPVSANTTGLTAGTTYYFRVKGTNSNSAVYGGILSFTTTALTNWSITASNANYTIGGSVPTLTGTASPSGGLSGSLTCNVYAISDTGYVTALTIDGLLPAGTYVIRCTGSTAVGYATPTITNATLTVSAAAPTTYTITASAGSNGSISPSGSVTVNSGENQSFTITANSGYEIDVLTVNSSTVSTVTTYTFTNVTSNQSISVTFKTVTSGNRGNSSGSASSNRNVKIIVQKISVGTTGTSSGQTILPSSRGTTATTGGQINALTNNTQSASASNNGAVVEAVNTTSTTSIVVDKNVPSSVAIERAVDNKVNVQGINGWTGRVSVAVVDENDPTAVQSFIEVAINPLPVSKVTINEANTVKEKKISFDPSPSEVVKYQVLVNNKIACESTTTSCALPQLVGPKSKVEIVAIGNDETRSIPEPFKIEYKKPIVALVVNFPVASSALSSRYRADLRGLARVLIREGFTRIQVDGHTDTQGVNIGYDNQALSDARSRATRAYLQRLVPGLKFVTSANSYRTPVADNVTPEGQFTNRRAEVKVW